jgi:hypothetical protein
MRLQLGNQLANIFYGEVGLSSNFVQMRRTGRSREKLKNRSPHAVLCRLQNLVPFCGETEAREIAPEKGFSRS